jgi:hypothetical protein
MKKIVFGILAGFLFVFVGCSDDDGYSLNDMWIGFGILQKSDVEVSAIVMDNKDVLVPVASNYPPGWSAQFDDGARVLINYTILDENLNDDGSVKSYYVKVNNIDDILMKGVMDITPENEDSIGNDPIIVEDYWMTDSLLSFKLKYWGYGATHFLNLVKEPGELTEPIELELRHNANGDEESIPYTAYVSFSLNGLRIEGQDSVMFTFKSTDYDGVEHMEEEEFNYKDLE